MKGTYKIVKKVRIICAGIDHLKHVNNLKFQGYTVQQASLLGIINSDGNTCIEAEKVMQEGELEK